jgi:photosystem II stability/assembly factor-like uncharacterized protein
MKNVLLKKLLLLLMTGFSLCCYSQAEMPEELRQRLANKKDFYSVKATVEKYYKEKISQQRTTDTFKIKRLNRQRKFWNRWFYESESRLNTNMEVENVTEKIYNYLSSSSYQQSESTSAARDAVANASWSHVGPNYVSAGIGRINRIATHPSNQSILYAGSAGGGLYKSTNAGVNWSAAGNFVPSLGVSGIVVSHANGQTIYVLTGDGDAYASRGLTFQYGYIRYSVGVLKSTDGGQTWTKTGVFPGLGDKKYVGFRLRQDPNNANILLAATSLGLFRTTNGGANWQKVILDGASSDQTTVFDVEYKPGSSNTVYCTFIKNPGMDLRDQNCVFARSTDGGQRFSSDSINYSYPLIEATRIEIAVTPANSSYVYLLCGPGNVTEDDDSDDTFKGLYRSTNSGSEFILRSDSPDILAYQDVVSQFKHQSLYDLALAVSPTNANVVVAGGLVVWRSENGGTSWDEIVDYFEDIDNSNYIHADVHELVYNPLNGYLYAGTDGGASVSQDNGDNWSRLFSGLSCTQFYKFEINNEDGDLWGGTQDNGILIQDGTSSTFDKFDGGDGYDVLTDRSPAGNNNDKYWVVNRSIWADGVYDVDITPDGTDEMFPNLAMSPTNEDVLYAGYANLFVSYDRGGEWKKFSSVAGNWCIGICPTNRKRVYSAGRKDDGDGNLLFRGLWRVDNLDHEDADVATNLTGALEAAGYPGKNPKITGIAVSPNGSNIVWVTVSGFNEGAKVFYSDNSGTSWHNVSGSLPNIPVNCITIVGEGVYIGTDIGVYFRSNLDSDWTPYYNGLPRVAVSELEMVYDVALTPILYAATYGRGIWKTKGFTECASSITINQELQGQKFYQANEINSTSALTGTAGTDVTFKAGTSVTLEPGFHAVASTDFTAFIGPCNGTGIAARVANISSDSTSAKIKDVVADRTTVSVQLDLLKKGDYSIRLVDPNSNLSLAEKIIEPGKSGVTSFNLEIPSSKQKYYRIDLMHNKQLISMQDFETIQ